MHGLEESSEETPAGRGPDWGPRSLWRGAQPVPQSRGGSGLSVFRVSRGPVQQSPHGGSEPRDKGRQFTGGQAA